MLAADVLISDYSSISFDYANLDRPIMLLVDDMGSLRQHPRHVLRHHRVPARAGGAVAGGVVSALQTGRFASAEAAKHRQLFREKFCEFDDGRAAERVVRRVFLGETDLPPIVPLADRHPAPSPHQL